MNAVVSEKGQVTIPKVIRDGLGLHAGAILDFREENGTIVAIKVVQRDPIAAWRGRGRLPAGRTVDQYLKESRGE